MKCRIRAIAVGVVVLGLTFAAAAWHVARRGSGDIEQWVGSQLLFVADSYLNPKNVRIIERNWFVYSFKVPGKLRLAQLVAAHLEALT